MEGDLSVPIGTLKLKRLAIVDAPVNDLKAERFVAGLRESVVNPCIRSHFDAAVTPRPIFCCRKQAAADTAVPSPFGDIPALQIADRPRRTAAIGMRSQVDLSKANECAIGGLGYEVNQRHASRSVASQYRFKLACVFLYRSFRPQRYPKACELITISRPRLSDANFHE